MPRRLTTCSANPLDRVFLTVVLHKELYPSVKDFLASGRLNAGRSAAEFNVFYQIGRFA